LLLTWWGIRSAARNERYARYVQRYEEIITHLPFGIFDEENEEIKIGDEQKVWLVAYIDLCSEELFDYLRGAIGGRIWKDWEKYIVSALTQSDPLKELFETYNETDYSDLKSLVEKKIAPRRRNAWQRLRAN